MCSVPSNVDNLNSHVILLKNLTDVGEVEMVMKHLKWIRSNCSSNFQNIMNELMASLSTSASLQHVTKLIQCLHSQRLVDDANPWMKLMQNVYAWIEIFRWVIHPPCKWGKNDWQYYVDCSGLNPYYKNKVYITVMKYHSLSVYAYHRMAISHKALESVHRILAVFLTSKGIMFM